MTRLEQLREQGFDLSKEYSDAEDCDVAGDARVISVRCSCCEALVINGVATHERGCPNAHKGANVGLDDDEEFFE